MRRVFAGALTIAAALHAGAVVERGSFRLHKMEQSIGEETYRIERDGGTLVLEADFSFRDRGEHVPLKSTLRLRPDYTPDRLDIKGKTSRFSTVDETLSAPGFTIAGYAPVSVQMALVRYWAGHARPASIPRTKTGTIGITSRGHDRVRRSDGSTQELDRLTVTGLIWGRETLWVDAGLRLAAAVTVDAEFDHFEAVADDYESSLPFFVRRAAEDNMAALGELAGKFESTRNETIAISGATLIDGTGAAPVRDSVVVARGGRIVAAGPRSSVAVPASAEIIDAHGRFVMPGLWDMHAHFEQVEWGPLYLAAGVTTARDCGNEFEFITAVRDALTQRHGVGPRLLLAGIVDGDGPRALTSIRANNSEQARAVVDKYISAHFDQIKIYSSLKPDVVKALCAEAHRRGVTCMGHVPFGMTARQGVENGMDGIEHFPYIQEALMSADTKAVNGEVPVVDIGSPAAQDGIRFFSKHGTVIGPTLSVFEWLWHEKDTPVERFEPGAAKVAPELRQSMESTGLSASRAAERKSVLESMERAVFALHQAGVPIIAGTDQTVPGWSLHRELELYVDGGMTPMEAIQTATLIPARVMKLDQDAGTIQAGRRADLLILDADPLKDIHNTRRIWRVVANGRVYDPGPLWESIGFSR